MISTHQRYCWLRLLALCSAREYVKFPFWVPFLFVLLLFLSPQFPHICLPVAGIAQLAGLVEFISDPLSPVWFFCYIELF